MQHGRCARELEDDVKKKIGMFSQLTCDKIISVHNVSEIYKVPLLLKSQNVAEIISNKLEMYLPKVSASNPTASVFVLRSCASVCMRVRVVKAPSSISYDMTVHRTDLMCFPQH